ncbi:MAG: tetratricopeptide repeat protein [Alphaproteobacteria bacterium]|nr:tetratricopeptide repeat protein [Alphaproteobacteria bacterium]
MAGGEPSPDEIGALVMLFSQARLAEAEPLARGMTGRFPDHGFGWKMLGAVLIEQGRGAEALSPLETAAALWPGDAEAHTNLASARKDQGRPSDADVGYRRALALMPGLVVALSNRGVTLRELGRLADAEAGYRRALAIDPDFVDAHGNLGNVLGDRGRTAEADASHRRALVLRPDAAEAHNNLGSVRRQQGRFDGAHANYGRALALRPGYAEAHANQGGTLQAAGRFGEATASLRRALALKPDQVEVLTAIAWGLNILGDPVAALGILRRVLHGRISETARSLFVDCARRVRFTRADDDIRRSLVRALSEPRDSPGKLSPTGAAFVRLNPVLDGAANRAPEHSSTALLEPAEVAAASADPLLRALLESGPVCDVGLERLLTRARRSLLEPVRSSDEAAPELFVALARQCFINEYVFACDADEAAEARALRDALAATLEAGSPVSVRRLVAVGAYVPLHALPNAGRLLDRAWPAGVNDLLRLQIREVEEERRIRSAIPRLTGIAGEVSGLVRSQYEENPYPRWIAAAPVAEPETIDALLARRLPWSGFRPLARDGGLDVLVAGCGTGKHSIGTAQRLKGARVLAVDLSLASLAYATRKARELGLTTVEHAQADLLELGALGLRFDVIESVGVLHHLVDPLAGWRVLLDLLRPGGVMRLGLYSETARRDIVRARTFIAEKGYRPTAEDIRRCRQDLMAPERRSGFAGVLRSTDFFSLSGCRDLLFHVQEHRMTLPAIAAFLEANGMRFLGFDIDAPAVDAYRRRFGDGQATTSLANWQVFERENPDTFFAMYQFWIQKQGPAAH